jgi:phage gp45-like
MRIIKCKVGSVADGEFQKTITGNARPNEEINLRSYFQHVGFSSIPREDSVAIGIIYGDNVTFFGTAEPVTERPKLFNAGDVCIYSDEDKYIKILASGNIEASNGNGSITLKANGDIELGSGAGLQKLLNESAATIFNAHVHADHGVATVTQMLSTHMTSTTQST